MLEIHRRCSRCRSYRGAEDGGQMNEGNQGRLKGNKIPEVHGNAEGIETMDGKCCEPECKVVWGALSREGQRTPGMCQVHIDIWSAEVSQGTGESCHSEDVWI